MKSILISTSETNGGAAIACTRLMHSLRKNGIDASLIVLDKQSTDKNVIAVNVGWCVKLRNKARFVWERGTIFFHNRFSKKNLFSVSIANTGNNIANRPEVKEADIIHLHWTNQGFLSVRDIESLIRLGKPVVWTMHDQWAYTGICHYASGCTNFTTHCQDCHKLAHPSKRDLSYRIFDKKRKWYQHKNISLVGCSQWIAGEAKNSSLSCKTNIFSIPNAIDTAFYQPKDKKAARDQFGLTDDKKHVLFGACKVTDKRKGIDYLVESCELLLRENKFTPDQLVIVVFGGKSDELASMLPYKVHNVGYIYDSASMVNLYNAVDLFLIPSLEDNLPNTIMEAMTCGTPCVGFNTGGIPEMIDHTINGYVAEYRSSADLAKGIHWVLTQCDYAKLAAGARKKAVDCYSESIVSKRYTDLYQKLLSGQEPD